MALTKNAERVYIGTNMGDAAREAADFEHFNSQWFAKMMMLSVSKKEEDKKTFEAMKAIKSIDFYYDANNYFKD